MFQVLLYYKFHKIENLETFIEEHRIFCQKNNILGRILIAEEGINGTCAGEKEDVQKYMDYVHSLPGFEDLWFKEQLIDKIPFRKLIIKKRNDLVNFGIEIKKLSHAKKITPEELNELIEKEDVIMFDMRNEIEGRIGRFDNAIVPNIRFSRQILNELDKYEDIKNKKIVMYCTGGIRCEKISPLFIEKGFKNLYQLEGGVYNYCTKFPNGHFKGNCFVFDDRMNIAFTSEGVTNKIPDDKIITDCDLCGVKSTRVVNDERKNGRVMLVCCEDCDKNLDISRVRTKEELKCNA